MAVAAPMAKPCALSTPISRTASRIAGLPTNSAIVRLPNLQRRYHTQTLRIGLYRDLRPRLRGWHASAAQWRR